jgi:pimeloyl-ACP methyl ester carboxylesterase/tetratricopeptide (TPR) repeat protein
VRVIRSEPAEAAIDLAGEAAAHLVKDALIVRNFEKKLVPNPGLIRLGTGFTLQPIGTLDNASPYLLFIHGTASNTMGSFGSIVAGKNVGLSINPPETEEWKAIVSIYGSRMIAYEHQTLTRSPIENAIELAEALPAGAKLHLVTHSRGGLVGELLCMARPSGGELDRLRKRGRKEDADNLEKLFAVTDSKSFQIPRFVRVACPARGTILASGRVDTYLTIAFNLLKLVQPMTANPLFAFLEATIRETAKLRTDPEQLPGLEAMMPESPLIRLLNTKGLVSDADLGVIAGDVEGEGILGTLKVLATDLFYLEDHDLVVNTRAMYGGLRRAKGSSFYFERGADVNHFNYFGNASTRRRLLEWLKGGKEGFNEITADRGAVTVAKSRGGESLATVFLIPGFFGTHLGEGEKRIWYDFDGLANGKAAQLQADNRFDDTQLSIVARGYQRIADHLSGSYDVKLFPYDWRQSIAEASQRLADELRKELDAHKRPVRIVAHSQGAFIALHCIATHGPDWAEIVGRKGRLVMLGAPLQGTYTGLQQLLGRDRFTRMLALIDDGQTPDLNKIVAGWPGLLEMLPRQPGAPGFSPALWPSAADRPDTEALAKAWLVAETAAKAAASSGVVQVLGLADRTVSRTRTNENGAFEFLTTPDGDGRVTFAGNTLAGRTWYMNACHGDLPDTDSAFPAILDLLENGSTVRLRSDSPTHAAGTAAEPLREERPLFPDPDALLDAALGKSERREAAPATRPIRVSVLHSDLRSAQFPVLVGHYQSDTIVHAEQILDNVFDRALSARFRMGIYPGKESTSDVVLPRAKTRPPGAIVVGLGQVGEITADKVRESVLNAILKFAMAKLEARPADGGFVSAAFSALLIGTYGARALTVEDSVGAILHAVVEANRVLRAQGLWDKVRVDAIQFVELYEQTAIQAVYAVWSASAATRFAIENGETFDIEPNLQCHASGRSQPPSNQYETGWWRRLEIATDKGPPQTLHFKLLTDRARSEQTGTASQQEVIDELVEKAIGSTAYNPKLAVAMFELLWPNELKDDPENRANLLLEVDADSAQIPWEMMGERTAKGLRPLATEGGLLRQFRTDKFRRAPRTSFEDTALVIGDPKLDDPSYPPLPGARDEATQVTEVLQGGKFQVDTLIQAEMLDVVTALFNRDYRILHIAAHGEYNRFGRTGVVMSRKRLLTALEFGQMRVMPDLVFLNCCHLGKIDPTLSDPRMKDMNRLAASVAQELLCDGVRAVVAAGWAVNDKAALTFAHKLYSALLAGKTFGSAVLDARTEIYNARFGSNTWAAYQCYGNPDFTLTARGSKRDSGPKQYRSSREYLDRVRNIARDAEGADQKLRGQLLDELRSLDRSIPEAWRDGEMLAAFGSAYADVGSFEDAVTAYLAAVHHPRSGSPIVAIEQLANLEDRHARQLMQDAARAAGPECEAIRKKALDWTEKAIERLEWLLILDETSERLSLLGGAYKRRAWVNHDVKDFAKAADYYARAALLEPSRVYAALNEATVKFLAGGADNNVILAMIERTKSRAKERSQKPEKEQDIWDRVALPDVLVLEAVVLWNLPIVVDSIKSSYATAIKGEGNWRNLASIRSQMVILSDFATDDAVKAALTSLIDVFQL